MRRRFRSGGVLAVAGSLWLGASRANEFSPYGPYDDHGTAGLTRVAGQLYANPVYGFAVAIPAGQTGWAAAPPSPDHGVRIFLGPRRSIEVDASYDTALLGSTASVAADAIARWPGSHASVTGTALSGRPARRIVVAGPGERRHVAVVAWSGQGAATPSSSTSPWRRLRAPRIGTSGCSTLSGSRFG